MSKNKNFTGEMKNQNEKGREVRQTNISAAKAVADVVRTSLGPRGMDKMDLPEFPTESLYDFYINFIQEFATKVD